MKIFILMKILVKKNKNMKIQDITLKNDKIINNP